MAATKRLLNTPLPTTPDTTLTLNGEQVPARTGELLVEAVNRTLEACESEIE